MKSEHPLSLWTTWDVWAERRVAGGGGNSCLLLKWSRVQNLFRKTGVVTEEFGSFINYPTQMLDSASNRPLQLGAVQSKTVAFNLF
jgi:hypothetical protein